MQYVAQMDLTPALTDTCGTTTAVWQGLLHGRAPWILRECGWGDISIHMEEGLLSISGKGAWHRRSQVQFVAAEHGTVVHAYASTQSAFAPTLAMGLGAIAGMLVLVGLLIGRQGSAMAFIGMVVVWLLVAAATYPVWWVIGKFVPVNTGEAEGYAAGLLELLEDPEHVEAARAALVAQAAEDATRYGTAEITEADLEPEDRTLSLDALERKYGLVKGGQVYAFINTRQDED